MSRPIKYLRNVGLGIIGLASLVPATALAQTTSNYGTITLTLRKPTGDGDFTDMTAEDQREFFNSAHCLCDTEVELELGLENPPSSLPSEEVEIWVGTSCDDDAATESERMERCKLVDTIADVGELRSIVRLRLGSQEVMFPTETGCLDDEASPTIYALIDDDDDDEFEASFSLEVTVDAEPPPAPTDVTSEGGEDAVILAWTLPTSNEGDIFGFQILCADSSGNPLPDANVEDPDYVTALMECGATGTETTVTADAGTSAVVDGGVDAAPPVDAPPTVDAAPVDAFVVPDGGFTGTFDQLDARFICGSATSTASSVRVPLNGFQGAVQLKIVVFDESGNATELDAPSATAQPVQDFWEVYGSEGGQAHGGFCAVVIGGRTTGLALTALGLGTLPIGLLLFRRRRRSPRTRGGKACGPLLVLSLVASAAGTTLLALRPASAQVVFDEDEDRDPNAILRSPWNVEVKFGPYTPSIDDEFSGSAHPAYETTFGSGARLMSQVEVDRFFLWPAGQLGVALTAGYLQNTADAFVENADGTPNFDERSDADTTAFRLIPTAASVVYRYTDLADYTYVPLVPYAKLGLSYYIWWITKGDGSLAESETGGKARGGTLGWQGSLGLALRLESLDPVASRSLQSELGVEHAGVFGEVTYADVSGLGMANKLDVGAFTWYAGLNFEF